MGIQAAEISAILKDQIKNFGQDAEVAEVGQVLSVGDGIARVYGLDKVQAGEMGASRVMHTDMLYNGRYFLRLKLSSFEVFFNKKTILRVKYFECSPLQVLRNVIIFLLGFYNIHLMSTLLGFHRYIAIFQKKISSSRMILS